MSDFNFFLPYIERKKKSTYNIMYWIIAIFIVVIFIVGSFLVNYISIRNSRVNIKKYETKILEVTSSEAYKQAEEKAEQYDVLSKYNTEISNVIASANNRKSITEENLILMTAAIPEGVKLSAVSINEKELVFTSVANSRLLIATYESNLKALKFVSEVYIDVIGKKDKAEEYTFKVTCKLR